MARTVRKKLSEEELIIALQQKHKIAMEAMYDMYSNALYGVIHRIVQSDEIAEDVLQEAFVKIWNTFTGYDASKGRLFTWIVNIARNLAIDKVRSKEFRNNSKNQELENNVIEIDGTKNSAFSPDEIGLKDLLDKVKPDQKVVLDLIYFKGYTHVEAAEKLDIPLGTVKTRLRMGIIALRKFFN